MTRARRSLAVMSNDNHEYLPTGAPTIQNRRSTPDPALFPGPRRLYLSANAEAVDLSFAGRLGDRNPALPAIAEAHVGDPVTLHLEDGKWLLLDARGRRLGRMARSFRAPVGASFSRGEISAILRRQAEDSEESYRHTLRRETWEVVLPELVFEVV
ncbi:MAG: hypothetical protein R3D80_21215 [Paracoccaceae bacterium]